MLSVIGAGLAPDVFHSGTPMNRNNDRNSRRALLAISGLFAASLVTAGNVETGELQISRTLELELPQEITTVGQAISYLLEDSGYRLLSAKLAEPYRVGLFAMPLPEAQRRLGPLSLRQALELLSGPAFRLAIDPVYRLVTFELLATSESRESDACASK
jgi:conjugative transfer region protein (TIGR03748 family)